MNLHNITYSLHNLPDLFADQNHPVPYDGINESRQKEGILTIKIEITVIIESKRGDLAMISRDKIDRINLLAKKSRTQGLSAEEKEEQTELRIEYLKALRKDYRIIMDNAFQEDPDKLSRRFNRRVH